VHDVGKGWLFDMGGIYNLGGAPGTVVRFNKIHDVRSNDLGAIGLYFDEGSSHVLAECNLIYNIQGDAFRQNYGEENVLRNNIIAFGKRSQLDRVSEDGGMYFTVERNIFYFTEGGVLGGQWGDGRYRMLANLYWNPRGTPLCFMQWSMQWSWEQWRERGNDNGGMIADPRFVAPDRGDFSLGDDSPAFKIGFVPFDLSQVGPREGKRNTMSDTKPKHTGATWLGICK
jgi:hypothetical protein